MSARRTDLISSQSELLKVSSHDGLPTWFDFFHGNLHLVLILLLCDTFPSSFLKGGKLLPGKVTLRKDGRSESAGDATPPGFPSPGKSNTRSSSIPALDNVSVSVHIISCTV